MPTKDTITNMDMQLIINQTLHHLVVHPLAKLVFKKPLGRLSKRFKDCLRGSRVTILCTKQATVAYLYTCHKKSYSLSCAERDLNVEIYAYAYEQLHADQRRARYAVEIPYGQTARELFHETYVKPIDFDMVEFGKEELELFSRMRKLSLLIA